ncbi:hypothetical protein SANTM175S_00133 [Streptomyces antimycoticus]
MRHLRLPGVRGAGVRGRHRRHRAGRAGRRLGDFVWQTGDTPDVERDGYHGIGPYRFRGEQYRAALKRLLTADGAPAPGVPTGPRALLIGQRAAVLAKLAAALRTIGIGAEITLDAVRAHADELRKYGAVVFGRTVGRGRA